MAPAAPDDPDRAIGGCPPVQCGEAMILFHRGEGRLIVEERRKAGHQGRGGSARRLAG
jgi:hypothetical protein